MRSGWFVVGVVGSAATAVTCYRPSAESECTLTCETTCPDSLVCGTDSLCHAAGAMNCTDRGREIPDAGSNGGSADAPMDAVTGPGNCYGSDPPYGRLKVCPTMTPQAITIGSAGKDIDTTTSQFCERTQQIGTSGMVCVVVGTTIDIQGTVKGTGMYPLVFVATDKIQIDATVSVASSVGGVAGAAGGRACGAGSGAPSGNGGGGGAGGSFNTAGGKGGDGFGGTGGLPLPAQLPGNVTGGCNGGGGGDGNAHAGVGGGLGGGAVFFISRTQIVVNSDINASGAGATGGNITAGGGGGGAGGMIGLDAPMLTFSSGTLFAAGGGGAEGGGASMGSNGGDPSDTSAAGGGNGPSCGGDGAKGGYSQAAGSGGSGTSPACAGGGGGGGDGYIYVEGPIVGGRFVPAPIP